MYKGGLGTPMTTQGFEVLALRNTPLNAQEWCKLIEARSSCIRPHLNSFTLSTLGRLMFLGPSRSSMYRYSHSLEDDAPVVSNEGDISVSLETQGIFACPESGIQYSEDVSKGYFALAGGVRCPGGVKYIWGLTRDGRWILAEVTFRGTQGSNFLGYEKAEKVHIGPASIPLILSITRSRPQEMWHTLGQAVTQWEYDRARRYTQAQKLGQEVREQDFAVSLIPE